MRIEWSVCGNSISKLPRQFSTTWQLQPMHRTEEILWKARSGQCRRLLQNTSLIRKMTGHLKTNAGGHCVSFNVGLSDSMQTGAAQSVGVVCERQRAEDCARSCANLMIKLVIGALFNWIISGVCWVILRILSENFHGCCLKRTMRRNVDMQSRVWTGAPQEVLCRRVTWEWKVETPELTWPRSRSISTWTRRWHKILMQDRNEEFTSYLFPLYKIFLFLPFISFSVLQTTLFL